MAKINIKKLEADLWESADLLRAESKLTSNQYCMPVLGLIFLRYAFSRYKLVEKEIMANRPVRNGRVMPVSSLDFKEKSAIYLPEMARFDYLVSLPDNVADLNLKSMNGEDMLKRTERKRRQGPYISMATMLRITRTTRRKLYVNHSTCEVNHQKTNKLCREEY